MIIVVIGNCYRLYGPFASLEDAKEWDRCWNHHDGYTVEYHRVSAPPKVRRRD